MSVIVELFCLAVAIWYVPRYLCRVYGIDVMSILQMVRPHREPAEPDAVRAHQYQVFRNELDNNVPMVEPDNKHKTTAEIISFLAIQVDDDEKYRYSANKIADLVGGTRADVLAQIAVHRPRATMPRTRPGRLERPVNGW